ncbi:MAG: transporter substrate-binding domain-containing protein [Candidatus Delongbacteria bacterium]|nr:transporter substrate-binding domain-containing protein [Candidatus Delongbacteria bacterium]
MKRIYFLIIFVFLSTIFSGISYAQETDNDVIKFTDEEKQWLESNKEITFGADFNWPPFDFVDKNDKHTGLSSEYIKIIEKQTGMKINVIPGVWSYILNQAKIGKIDGIAAAVKTSEREEYLKFSEPFIEIPLVIITRSDNEKINTFNDLKDKIIAINKGSYIHEYLVKNKLDVYLTIKSSNNECLEAVSYGKADAYIGNLSVYTHIAEEEMITNLKVIGEMPGLTAPISIAVTNDNVILRGIINKVLGNMSDVEHRDLRDKWFEESLLSECEILHTKREHQWIMEHPVIRIAGEPNWAPLSYYDDKDNYVGVVPDIWKLIEKRGGIKVERVRSEDWSHTIDMFKNNEIDIIEAITPTEKRREFADFTNIYLKVDYVIITRIDVNYIKNFKSLDLTTIGVVEGYEIQEHITKQFPNQELKGYKSAEEGLKALSYGEIYAFILDVASFEFYSKKNGLSNIKISGVSPFFYEIAIGVAKGNRELIAILNKTLETITDEEYKELFNRWSTISEPLIDYSLVWKVVLFAIVVLIFIFYWNRRLSNEVALRKKTEIELMKAKDIAEKATNAKSEFLANMSHEIRTPMNAVIGFSELLQQTPLTHKQESYLATIVSGGHTLLDLINDILDISKIEANKLEILYSSFDIVSTVYEIEQFFDERLKAKGLQLLFEQDPSFRSYVILDENRLRQILFNLVSNSIKFTNSGYVKLTTKFTKIENEAYKMEIVIEDTGIGIKDSQLSQIFDSFVQAGDLKTKRNIKGTGLGLSITKRLVELMNGSITVESELKKGTKFVIAFMDVKTEERSDYGDVRSKDSGIITFDKAKVLIVDDVESNRLLLKEICEDYGFEIYEAENGEESIAKAKLYVPDMILMDIRMPVMDGYEAITHLKKDPNLERIPVIAVTASVMSRESDKLKEYKFDGYLRKPILRKEIVKKFKEFIHYTIDENKEIKTTLVNDELVEGNNFLIELNGTLYEQYKNSVEKHNLDDIMQFARDLYELAAKHNSGSIMNYSKEMEIAAKNFDISTIKDLLVKYEGMIKNVKT